MQTLGMTPIPPPVLSDLVRSTDSTYKVVFIGHLNTDCYDDTVVSVVAKTATVNWRKDMILPKYVIWGKYRDSTQAICPDSAGGTIPDSLKNSYSIIAYPSFVGLRGSLSYVHLNNNDTEYDLLCFLWGKTDTSSTRRDTSTRFAVFGRKGMDTLGILPFHTIDTTQQRPVQAMLLRRPINFLQPGRRDFTGQKSYVIPSMVLVVVTDSIGTRDSVVIQQIASGLEPEHTLAPDFRVYPNPAVNLTTIVGKNLGSGNYRIELMTQSGQSVWSKEVKSQVGEDIVFSMDVSSVTTGYYHIVVYRQDKAPVGTFPILIIH